MWQLNIAINFVLWYVIVDTKCLGINIEDNLSVHLESHRKFKFTYYKFGVGRNCFNQRINICMIMNILRNLFIDSELCVFFLLHDCDDRYYIPTLTFSENVAIYLAIKYDHEVC